MVVVSQPLPDPLVRNTTTGLVRGYLDVNTTGVPLYKWYGVRFAETTAGANRWRPPQPYYAEGITNTTAFGAACMQGIPNAGNGTQNQSEDCLFINVIAPMGATNLPVYLYSFGGGFDSNAASDPKIDGSWLASRDIVYVSYNYRLSIWAWPAAVEIAQAGETQNFGLLDTRTAVEWVRDNIVNFGGDPTKITLGGESVGAEMTNMYMSAWPEDPIIRGAVMQSADTSQPMWELGNQLIPISQNLSCTTGPGQLDCLRTKDAFAIQAILWSSGAQFQPVIDNITVFQDYVRLIITGQTARIPLLIGNNKDEGSTIVNGEPTAYTNETAYILSNNFNFPMANINAVLNMYPSPSALYPTTINATSAMWRDAHMISLSSNLALWRTQLLQLPVWRYEFALVADNLNALGASIGTFHVGEDIQFVMGTLYTIADQAPYIPATPFQYNVSDYMVTAWTNFVKDPTLGPRIEGWEQYNPADPTTLAVLGISETGAIPGNASAIDSTIQYWNQILPLFPRTYPACGTWTCSD
ncbi:Alpha/Beta hydrolase protein [Sparassis latifolia]